MDQQQHLHPPPRRPPPPPTKPQPQTEAIQQELQYENTGIDDNCVLWIRDIDPSTTAITLARCFRNKGLVRVYAIHDGPERYGFLEFKTHTDAEKVFIEGGCKQIPGSKNLLVFNWLPSRKISVENLADLVDDEMLLLRFQAYHSVKSAMVRSSNGFGFVEFGSQTEQLHALTYQNGELLLDLPMRIRPFTGHASGSQRYVRGPIDPQLELSCWDDGYYLSYRGCVTVANELPPDAKWWDSKHFASAGSGCTPTAKTVGSIKQQPDLSQLNGEHGDVKQVDRTATRHRPAVLRAMLKAQSDAEISRRRDETVKALRLLPDLSLSKGRRGLQVVEGWDIEKFVSADYRGAPAAAISRAMTTSDVAQAEGGEGKDVATEEAARGFGNETSYSSPGNTRQGYGMAHRYEGGEGKDVATEEAASGFGNETSYFSPGNTRQGYGMAPRYADLHRQGYAASGSAYPAYRATPESSCSYSDMEPHAGYVRPSARKRGREHHNAYGSISGYDTHGSSGATYGPAGAFPPQHASGYSSYPGYSGGGYDQV